MLYSCAKLIIIAFTHLYSTSKKLNQGRCRNDKTRPRLFVDYWSIITKINFEIILYPIPPLLLPCPPINISLNLATLLFQLPLHFPITSTSVLHLHSPFLLHSPFPPVFSTFNLTINFIPHTLLHLILSP